MPWWQEKTPTCFMCCSGRGTSGAEGVLSEGHVGWSHARGQWLWPQWHRGTTLAAASQVGPLELSFFLAYDLLSLMHINYFSLENWWCVKLCCTFGARTNRIMQEAVIKLSFCHSVLSWIGNCSFKVAWCCTWDVALVRYSNVYTTL